MKKIIAFIIIFCSIISLQAQKIKLKHTINYNAFGMGILPHDQLMFGGNHVFYKSIGMAISYRFGIKDLLAPTQDGETGELELFKNAKAKNLLTGKTSTAYSFAIIPSIAIAITHKIPLYIGMGITRKKVYKEYYAADTISKFWFVDDAETKILPTFTVGTFIPIYRRLLLNIAYDYLPQTVFVGISIRSWESWDEFN
ncbi:MAG: hypothetical protein K9G64_06480 [Bacteroidia bacterium]|nr:hypothetical protein [Bacteroidia bacterium]